MIDNPFVTPLIKDFYDVYLENILSIISNKDLYLFLDLETNEWDIKDSYNHILIRTPNLDEAIAYFSILEEQEEHCNKQISIQDSIQTVVGWKYGRKREKRTD